MENQTALILPDPLLLKLYRYSWKPIRYAHPDWLNIIGFQSAKNWRYGENSSLDEALNQALQQYRGVPSLGSLLTSREQRLARLDTVITSVAIGLGLMVLDCSDYFLLPDYRQVIGQWLSEESISQLFGLSNGKQDVFYTPDKLIDCAILLGSSVLNRLAIDEPVLHALLILLPPQKRALWPRIPNGTSIVLEQVLCPNEN